MNVYRITGRKYAHDLSGHGAALYGGRWNKRGTLLLYTGESKEIALLETIVNVPANFAPKLDLLTIQIPDNSILEIFIKELPVNWSQYPAPSILSEMTEKWVFSNNSIALKVPSSIIHSAHNYLLNCSHPQYDKVKLLDRTHFFFDTRLKN